MSNLIQEIKEYLLQNKFEEDGENNRFSLHGVNNADVVWANDRIISGIGSITLIWLEFDGYPLNVNIYFAPDSMWCDPMDLFWGCIRTLDDLKKVFSLIFLDPNFIINHTNTQ